MESEKRKWSKKLGNKVEWENRENWTPKVEEKVIWENGESK